MNHGPYFIEPRALINSACQTHDGTILLTKHHVVICQDIILSVTFVFVKLVTFINELECNQSETI